MANEPSQLSHAKPSKIFYAKNFDKFLFLFVLLLLVVGLMCLFSSSHAYANYYENDSYFYIKKQLVFALIGLLVMFAASIVDYHIYHKFAAMFYGVSVFLLVLVLAMPSSTGVHRWIYLPVINNFQPSELAKFAIILLFAHIISLNYKSMGNTKMFFITMALLGVVCGLTIIEPHLSGTILLAGIGIIMLFVGGINRPLLGLCIAAGIAAVAFLVFVKGYEHDRIEVWLDPMGTFAKDRDQAWQTVQSLFAIGSGGMVGLGIGNSRQKHLFLPEPQNDFIYSVICEELGFVGALIVIVLFLCLIIKGLSIARRANDKFGSMIALGITAQIFIQLLLNIAVVTNSMPNTGIGLPFFSYGGTSLIMLLGEIGVLFSVSRQAKKRGK